MLRGEFKLIVVLALENVDFHGERLGEEAHNCILETKF